MKNKIRIYLSHWIRGPKGNDATDEDIKKNIELAIDLGKQLKSYFWDWYTQYVKLPEVDLYVPANHDEFVCIAYKKGLISEADILNVDCEIISRCDILLVWGDYTKSRGMAVEFNHAYKLGMPILNFSQLDKQTLSILKNLIGNVANET